MASKRDKPATPSRGGADEEQDKIHSPPKKTVFTGEKAMDQDINWAKPGEPTPAEAAAVEERRKRVLEAAAAEERRKRLLERQAKKAALEEKIAKQQETGRKEKTADKNAT